jgi:phage FluMu protein Com
MNDIYEQKAQKYKYKYYKLKTKYNGEGGSNTFQIFGKTKKAAKEAYSNTKEAAKEAYSNTKEAYSNFVKSKEEKESDAQKEKKAKEDAEFHNKCLQIIKDEGSTGAYYKLMSRRYQKMQDEFRDPNATTFSSQYELTDYIKAKCPTLTELDEIDRKEEEQQRQERIQYENDRPRREAAEATARALREEKDKAYALQKAKEEQARQDRISKMTKEEYAAYLDKMVPNDWR